MFPLYLCTSVPLYLCTSVPLYLCTSVPLYLCTSVPLCLCVSVSLCLCVSVSLWWILKSNSIALVKAQHFLPACSNHLLGPEQGGDRLGIGDLAAAYGGDGLIQ